MSLKPSLEDKISSCKATRRFAAECMAKILRTAEGCSELDIKNKLDAELAANANLHKSGWYDPPPGGTAVLFGKPPRHERLLFDTLRKEVFWPKSDNILQPDGTGTLYVSPFHRDSGIIGDFGLTIYLGREPKVRAHISACLKAMEEAAENVQIGMKFKDIHGYAQKKFKEHGVQSKTIATQSDPLGTNFGHTVPWTYEDPTPEERAMLQGNDLRSIKDLVSKKRVYVNRAEEFKVPENIVFTLESRLESAADPAMPNVFFHMMILFRGGAKEILADFTPVFKAAGMDSYIISKYG